MNRHDLGTFIYDYPALVNPTAVPFLSSLRMFPFNPPLCSRRATPTVAQSVRGAHAFYRTTQSRVVREEANLSNAAV